MAARDAALTTAMPDEIVPDQILPDEVLVEQLRLGNRGAFDLLYERYFKRIHYFVQRRLDNRADAEPVRSNEGCCECSASQCLHRVFLELRAICAGMTACQPIQGGVWAEIVTKFGTEKHRDTGVGHEASFLWLIDDRCREG